MIANKIYADRCMKGGNTRIVRSLLRYYAYLVDCEVEGQKEIYLFQSCQRRTKTVNMAASCRKKEHSSFIRIIHKNGYILMALYSKKRFIRLHYL